MSFFIVDVESDGPAPGLYSMISFGAIKVDIELKTGFRCYMKPISEKYIPSALAISSISREQQLLYPDPKLAMIEFVNWVKSNSKGRPIFVSDNLAFDWQFINYYCHLFADENPFGYSGRRIGDFYSGLKRDFHASSKWKKYRNTTHDHDPLNDAIGNAEALLKICSDYGINVPE